MLLNYQFSGPNYHLYQLYQCVEVANNFPLSWWRLHRQFQVCFINFLIVQDLIILYFQILLAPCSKWRSATISPYWPTSKPSSLTSRCPDWIQLYLSSELLQPVDEVFILTSSILKFVDLTARIFSHKLNLNLNYFSLLSSLPGYGSTYNIAVVNFVSLAIHIRCA